MGYESYKRLHKSLKGFQEIEKDIERDIVERGKKRIWDILLEYERKLRNELIFAFVAKGVL